MAKTKLCALVVLCGLASLPVAQAGGNGIYLSPNGYSGFGLVPSAKTIDKGVAAFSFDETVAGAPVSAGYNYNLGFGLTDHLEMTGRLVTQDLKCNFFADQCPPGTIRDLSASFKYSIGHAWLKAQGLDVAVGATDVSGAATHFRTYYGVIGKSWDKVDLNLGYARAKAPFSPVDGVMASLQWRPVTPLRLAVEKAGEHHFVHAGVELPTPVKGVHASFQISQRLSDAGVTPRHWIGVGIHFPLQKVDSRDTRQTQTAQRGEVAPLPEQELGSLLSRHGFHKYRAGKTASGVLLLVVENQAYDWNTLDAAGVAAGVVASVFGHDASDLPFELVIEQFGVRQLRLKGRAQCLRLWLESEKTCEHLQLDAPNQGWGQPASDAASAEWFLVSDPDYRPSVVLSPRVVNAVGTEIGTLDTDVGLNSAIELPLWPGAALEINRVDPLDLNSRNFRIGHPFFLSRVYTTVNRRLLHQVVPLHKINTLLRLSYGEVNELWTGLQVHTRTESPDGRHSLEWQQGSFDFETARRTYHSSYGVFRYGFSHNDAKTAVSELEWGQYWSGDKGYRLTHRFWYGDTSLGLFFKRTTMPNSDKHVSFAGFEFSLPLTPRKSTGWKHFGVRGASAWRHWIETKVLENDNIITSGHGFLPDLGEGMQRLSNRGRNTTQYYSANLWRLRSAYWDLRKP